MTSTSGNGRQEESSNPRTYIRPALRAELDHLDLTGQASINNLRVVASGSFGDISKAQCTLGDGREITAAVKRLRFYLKEDIDLIFEKEIYVWSKLKHTNVLSLLGFAFEESSGYPLLLSEWMEKGSSLNYVKTNDDCDLIRLVTGIAEGLAYLHDNGIIHSDIKPDNVVVTDTGEARVCDFGGSRIADASKSVAKPSTGIRGTLRYLAYELVAMLDKYPRHSKESDVWSFGMTIFALISQEHPYVLLGDAQVAKAIADRELPSFYFWTTRSLEEKAILRDICHLCWTHEPNRRVAMTFIAASIRDFMSHRNVGNTSSNIDVIVDSNRDFRLNENGCSYKPLVILSSKLDTLNGRIDATSEIHQYLHSATKVSLSLYNVFVKEFNIDVKLDHLMRAMVDVLIFVTARSMILFLLNEKQKLIRLLQQVTECHLFVNKYSRKSLEERKLITSDGRKISEFISFFVSSKEAFDQGKSVLPAFVSSRVAYSIDEFVLRQRLNPNETDTKGQRLCLLGTRVAVQEKIIEWALSELAPNILWLHGVAGSGKSTVIASVAEHFRGIYRLGSFIRFKRGASDPSSVISTIAFKLAQFDSTIGSLILAETDRDKDVANASLSTQFEKLLVEPLYAAVEAQKGPVIVTLDALDECGTSTTRKSLMQVLLRGVGRLPSNFKFIITSRPEKDLDIAFNTLQNDSITILELDYTSQVSRSDVQLYLTHEIRSIVEDEDIPQDGSLEKQLTIIGERAEGLFVWASTFVKLVSEYDSPLEKLTEMTSNVRSLSGLNQLYSTVLRNSGISWHDITSKTRFQRVIGIILLSKMPLTETTIDAILGPSVGKCRATLSRLRSVIYFRPGEPIRLFHTSFSDFLMTSGHAEGWFVDIHEQDSLLAIRCFEIMKEELRFNICGLNSSFIRNNEVDVMEDRIESRVLPHASYACRFWSHHLCKVPYGKVLFHGLLVFLYNRLLHWLEVLSLLESINIAGPMLLATMKWIGSKEIETTAFLRDARRMISIFALPISQSAPHIYISMLPLMVDESRISAHYLQSTSSLVCVTRFGVKSQSPLLKLLEGHTGLVSSVDFSSNGSLIASGSYDGTVRIWDTERGELTAGPFDGLVRYISSISFSPDGTRIVLGGASGIAILDVESGSIIVGPFGGYAESITVSPDDKYVVSASSNELNAWRLAFANVEAVLNKLSGGFGRLKKKSLPSLPLSEYASTSSVTVSPDGKYIVSASSKLINMWDVESGMMVNKPFIGHFGCILCVSYSPDGCFIVSGSEDRSVRIWDVESRKLVHEPFIEHREGVNSVSFSPDGKYVVSGSTDADIRIWNLEKGEIEYSPLTGHTGGINSVAYSSDDTRIVSGSKDNTVRIWNSQNGQLVAGPFTHKDSVHCVAFSSDGTRVASGYQDGTLRIWDAEGGKADFGYGPKPLGEVEAVRFSLDGSCVISDKGTTWRIEGGKVISKGSDEAQRKALATTDGMRFSFKGTLEWNPYTGRVLNYNGSRDYPILIAVSPNGKRIAFSSRGGMVKIWDRERDVLVCEPFGSKGLYRVINSLTFSPDGKYIAFGSDDLRVLNAETGELLYNLFTGYTIHSIACSPDGRHVASGSGYLGNTVIIWNLETECSEVFEGHTECVNSISYSSDGSFLVSCSNDGEIRIWNTSTSEALVPMDQDRLLTSSNIDLSKWTLDNDGWIRGTRNEPLLWIPPDLRPTLCVPPNIAILNNREGFSTALDFSGSAQGERWHECFRPLE